MAILVPDKCLIVLECYIFFHKNRKLSFADISHKSYFGSITNYKVHKDQFCETHQVNTNPPFLALQSALRYSLSLSLLYLGLMNTRHQ